MNENPIFTKHFFGVLFVFLLFLAIFCFCINRLGLFSPAFDEDGDIYNGLYLDGLLFSGSLTYFCEGYIGWILGKETKEYCKRKHKKKALILLTCTLCGILLFAFFDYIGMSRRWAGIVADLIPWGYAAFLILDSYTSK